MSKAPAPKGAAPKGVAYAWKPGSREPVAAEIAGHELDRIRRKMGGHFRPADVVDENRRKIDPLYPVFEWDNWKAAESWRGAQARQMMSNLVTVQGGEPVEDAPRAFVSVRVKELDEDDIARPVHVFTSMAAAMADDELRQQVVEEAFDSMRVFVRRFACIADLAGLSGMRGIPELIAALDAMHVALAALDKEIPAQHPHPVADPPGRGLAGRGGASHGTAWRGRTGTAGTG